jgi:hypothetical protein
LSREKIKSSPRDNVLLELGLFIGALGRKRTFIVYDRRSGIELPSDLAGVTPATYQEHTSGNLKSSLGAPCTLIKDAIRSLGPVDRRNLSTTIDENAQFQVITDLLEIPAQQFLIQMHLQNLTLTREGAFAPGIPYDYALKDRSAGHGHFSISKLCEKLPDANLLQQDLRGRVTLTPRGHTYAAWLLSNGFKADFFSSGIGAWGEPPTDMLQFLGPRLSRQTVRQGPATSDSASTAPIGPSA